MKRKTLLLVLTTTLLSLFLAQPVYVAATQGFTENPGNSWISLNSSNGNKFFLHNSSNGNNLEFATLTGGVMNWQALSINKNGNVGIGTIDAQSKLHVVGMNHGGQVQFQFSSTTKRMGIRAYKDTGGEYMLFYTDVPASQFPLIINANTGRVGIGTMNPSHALSVNGGIKAREVVVSNSGWADYVFDKDYKLIPLSEVEKFVEANNHLPNIPSAQDIETQGISVGDMQRLQMEKIEELTLHLIEKDKQIQSLEERLSKLENLFKN